MSGKTIYPLGRRPSPDARDAAHPMRAVAMAALPNHRYWTSGQVMDQGTVPMCVGFAWKQWLATSPVRHAADKLSAAEIYRQAQQRDEWPGEGYEGTSVRGGAKYMQDAGHLKEYVWAQSVDEIARWLLTSGPVVLGTNWYSEMFQPVEGVAHVGGSVAGGHAFLAIGFSAQLQAFRCINSWGRSWGDNGRFWITTRDLARLLQEDGEACTGAEVG